MSVCSLRWLAEDVLSVGRWLVRETADEVHARFWKAVERLDTHLQPPHVRRAWDGMLAEEAVERVRAEARGDTEAVEPPKVSVCAKCGTTLGEIACVSDMVDGMFCSDRCRKVAEVRAALKEDSVAASATDGPTGGEAPPPLPPPVGPPPMPPYWEAFVPEADRIPTSELLSEAADYINATFPLRDTKYVDDLTATLYRRADAFRAVENTP